jgi:hypothetical protein
MVTINEVITLVDIALGEQPISVCVQGTKGSVNIADLVTAVNNALHGCG